MSRPDSYAEQDGCHNCRHVFVREEYEEYDFYYCALRAGPRPQCGSAAMNEWWGKNTTHSSANWEAWARDRAVEAWGICGEHSKADDHPPGGALKQLV